MIAGIDTCSADLMSAVLLFTRSTWSTFGHPQSLERISKRAKCRCKFYPG